MSAEVVAILTVGVTLLAVMLGGMVPILVRINGKLHALGERMARIEG